MYVCSPIFGCVISTYVRIQKCWFPLETLIIPHKRLTFTRRSHDRYCISVRGCSSYWPRRSSSRCSLSHRQKMTSPSPRTALRATMPHVITQWQAEQFRQEDPRSRKSLRPAKSHGDFLSMSTAPTRKQPGTYPRSLRPALSTVPPNEVWDFGSIRHIRQGSSDVITPTSAAESIIREYTSEASTPASAVDSIFELPSADIINTHSPGSSTHSCFMAELEDTSPKPTKISARSRGHSAPTKLSTNSTSTMEYKTTQMTVGHKRYMGSRLY